MWTYSYFHSSVYGDLFKDSAFANKQIKYTKQMVQINILVFDNFENSNTDWQERIKGQALSDSDLQDLKGA